MPQQVSETFRLSFELPETWIFLENKEIGGIQIFPPQKDEADNYSENLSIIVRNQDQRLDDAQTVVSYITSELIKSNYESHTNCILLRLGQLEVSGQLGRQTEFAYRDNRREEIMHAWQVVFITSSRLFLITYTARERFYAEYLEGMQSVVESLEVG